MEIAYEVKSVTDTNNASIPETDIDSELNDLVDKLEHETNSGKLKLMNDGMFDIDDRHEIDAAFDFGNPEKRKDDCEVIYV